jgi:hypothetical protein
MKMFSKKSVVLALTFVVLTVGSVLATIPYPYDGWISVFDAIGGIQQDSYHTFVPDHPPKQIDPDAKTAKDGAKTAQTTNLNCRTDAYNAFISAKTSGNLAKAVYNHLLTHENATDLYTDAPVGVVHCVNGTDYMQLSKDKYAVGQDYKYAADFWVDCGNDSWGGADWANATSFYNLALTQYNIGKGFGYNYVLSNANDAKTYYDSAVNCLRTYHSVAYPICNGCP